MSEDVSRERSDPRQDDPRQGGERDVDAPEPSHPAWPPVPQQWSPTPTTPPEGEQPTQPMTLPPQHAQPAPPPHFAEPQHWQTAPTSPPPQHWVEPGAGVGPVSGGPVSGAGGPTSAPPVYDSPWSADPVSSSPAFDDMSSSTASRIEWTQPQKRSKLVPGLLIGLLVGVLLAGTGGFFLGRSMTGDSDGGGEPTGQPTTAAGSLAPYESNLVAVNKAKFTGDTTALAEPWLAAMGGCTADTDTGGPGLSDGEKAHVLCRNGGVFLHFASYETTAQKEVARNYRQQLALLGPELAPGLSQPERKTGGVSEESGMYIEYAFRGSDGRTLCGFWWDRDGATAALYAEALCEETLGGRWEAMRDLWQRHS